MLVIVAGLGHAWYCQKGSSKNVRRNFLSIVFPPLISKALRVRFSISFQMVSVNDECIMTHANVKDNRSSIVPSAIVPKCLT